MSDLKDMIDKKALNRPNDIAFVYPCESGEMRKTYMDLRNDVMAMGTWIYNKKLKNKNIGLIGENSYEWLVVYFALVNGGNVAVAIDKGLPEEEMKVLAATGDVDTVFVSPTYFDKVNKKVGKKAYNLKNFDEMLSEGRKPLKDGKDEFTEV